jgi:hypothetical protein
MVIRKGKHGRINLCFLLVEFREGEGNLYGLYLSFSRPHEVILLLFAIICIIFGCDLKMLFLP